MSKTQRQIIEDMQLLQGAYEEYQSLISIEDSISIYRGLILNQLNQKFEHLLGCLWET